MLAYESHIQEENECRPRAKASTWQCLARGAGILQIEHVAVALGATAVEPVLAAVGHSVG